MSTDTVSTLLRRHAVLVALALVLYVFAFAGSRGMFSPDEGRYSNVAIEMLRSGDWIHPHLSAAYEHYTKPPLTYWTIAASLKVFGLSEWAARLPYGLALLVQLACLVGIGRRLTPDRPWLPPLVHATMVVPYFAATAVTPDMLLAATIALYTYAFVAARHAPERQPGLIALLWCGVGLAFLTKGPPGLLPLAGLLVVAFVERRERPLSRYFSVLGFALFAVVGLAWYLKVVTDRPGLLQYFLVDEVLHRVASGVKHRNQQWYGAFVVYLPTLLIGSAPWLWPVWRGLWRMASAPRAFLAECRSDATTRLLALWIGLPLVVFFLARSRLPLYVLPLFPPLAVAIARGVGPLGRGHALALAVWAIVLVGGRAAAAHYDFKDDDRALAGQVRDLGLATIDRFAFVDDAARYGLGIYFNVEVERMTTGNDPTDTDEARDVTTALNDPAPGCRLFLVVPRAVADFRKVAAAHGDAVVDLPAVGEYQAFSLNAACKR